MGKLTFPISACRKSNFRQAGQTIEKVLRFRRNASVGGIAKENLIYKPFGGIFPCLYPNMPRKVIPCFTSLRINPSKIYPPKGAGSFQIIEILSDKEELRRSIGYSK